MENKIRYTHTNLIAGDWQRLAQFYIDVFECRPQLPERDLSGEWIDRLTMIDGARIRGIHLALPGYENGPTLEIFEYSPADQEIFKKNINSMGFGHIAFHVESVQEVTETPVRRG